MTDDSDVPDELWERGHIEEESLVKSRLWHVFLLHDPFPRLYRGDYRFSEGLSVFFLDESLDILAIHVGCRWVILFVFVEDYGVMNGFYDCRRVILASVGLKETSEARRETGSFDSRRMIKPGGWRNKEHTVDFHKSPRSGFVCHLFVLVIKTFQRSRSLGLGRTSMRILLRLVIVLVVRVKVCTNVVSKLVVIVKRSHGW